MYANLVKPIAVPTLDGRATMFAKVAGLLRGQLIGAEFTFSVNQPEVLAFDDTTGGISSALSATAL